MALRGDGKGIWVRNRIRLLLAAALALVGPASAHAGSFVPNPVLVANSVDVPLAVVTLVGTTTGMPAGGITLGGSAAPSDLTLLLTVQYVGPGSPTLSQLGLFADPLWSSVGWIPGPGVNWTMGAATVGAALAQSAAIAPGATTDVLFVTVPSIDVGKVIDVAFWNGSSNASGQGEALVTWVPEPGTLALMTGGLGMLVRARRP